MTFNIEYWEFPVKDSSAAFEMYGTCSYCKHVGDLNGIYRNCKGHSNFEQNSSKSVRQGSKVFDDLRSIKDDIREFMGKQCKERVVMGLKDFSIIMETIQNSYLKFNKILDVLPSTALNDVYDVLFDVILDLLENHFNDEDAWISYWVFDLEFGKKYKPGMIIIDKEDVSLKTIEDLYKVIS